MILQQAAQPVIHQVWTVIYQVPAVMQALVEVRNPELSHRQLYLEVYRMCWNTVSTSHSVLIIIPFRVFC